MKKETALMIEKLTAENESRLFDLYTNVVSGDTEMMQSWITDPTVVDMWIAKAEDQDTTVEALIDAELVEAGCSGISRQREKPCIKHGLTEE